MKRTKLWSIPLALVLAGTSIFVGISVAGADDDDDEYTWDIVSLDPSTSPPTVRRGGIASAKANDGHKITMTGSGKFDADDDDAKGGGTYKIFDPDGNEIASGTYKVKELVRFELAPGGLPEGAVNDENGDIRDARAGLAVFRIKYSDGKQGILVVSCHLAGTPDAVFEGITASHAFVDFWEREAPSDGVDANRTIFHVDD